MIPLLPSHPPSTTPQELSERYQAAAALGDTLDLPELSLRYQDFSGRSYAGSHFPGSVWDLSDMTRIDLSRCNLVQSSFLGCTLELANLWATDCSEATFIKTNLRSVQLASSHLLRANFQGAVAPGIILTASEMGQAWCERADFHSAFLDSVEAEASNFHRADLSHAQATGANFSGANFHQARLFGTNLLWSDLSFCNLVDAVLTRTALYGVNLLGAVFSSKEQVLEAALQPIQEAVFFTLGEIGKQAVRAFQQAVPLPWTKNPFESMGLLKEAEDRQQTEQKEAAYNFAQGAVSIQNKSHLERRSQPEEEEQQNPVACIFQDWLTLFLSL